ncbi:hypothetical protein TIFTF001_002129 [Ficus carica]|uniref:Uncharacterized protein n=1 Tax=Ficus carica TaxID=3494 RepID=A0AA87ZLC9_FICCA|nr:hypothetical protein TIFTF001_002129 [Ficus carica]
MEICKKLQLKQKKKKKKTVRLRGLPRATPLFLATHEKSSPSRVTLKLTRFSTNVVLLTMFARAIRRCDFSVICSQFASSLNFIFVTIFGCSIVFPDGDGET